MAEIPFNKIKYYCNNYAKTKQSTASIEVIGIDTEAYSNGQLAIICLSDGGVVKPDDCPAFFFTRKYRQMNFVAYNLSYDEGALLQFLNVDELKELKSEGKITWGDYVITSIPKKMLSIRRGSHSVHIWDIYTFFSGSLNYNAEKYLGKKKLDIETKSFTKNYFLKNYEKIIDYCIQDAVLVKELAEYLIKTFEKFGIYPRKLYSTAYISYMYFQKSCNYVTVKKIWERDKRILEFALKSYSGGKFEVTEKGCDYYYEYDIISAYPAEIAALVDISFARYKWSNKYERYAVYGFLHVKMKIIKDIHSPVVVKQSGVCTFPIGYLDVYITKKEYEFFISQNIDVTIIEACWLFCDVKKYPYKREIERLVELKQQHKNNRDGLEYHTVKILMNSLYGKFCQLIKKKDEYIASSCWNIIYASVITSNVRIRVSEIQNKYPDVVAVHTDSVISKSKIPEFSGQKLGDMTFEKEGFGVVMGSGVYQIGDKSRFRTFRINTPILDLLDVHAATQVITQNHSFSWREIAQRNWEHDMINRFEVIEKKWHVASDHKRLWIDDYKKFSDVKLRKVSSLPIYNIDTFRKR